MKTSSDEVHFCASIRGSMNDSSDEVHFCASIRGSMKTSPDEIHRFAKIIQPQARQNRGDLLLCVE